MPWIWDSCCAPENILQIHWTFPCAKKPEKVVGFLTLLQWALSLPPLRQMVCKEGFPKSTWYWLSPASRIQGKYLLRHLETPPGVAQVTGDFHMCFDLSVWSFFATKILWGADSQHSWRLLIPVLQQVSARFAFVVISVRSEDPDPAELQHRETQRAFPELPEGFPVQIKWEQWLCGLQTLLDDEQCNALQKGTGQGYGNLDTTSKSWC